ncbi:MAG: RING finger protein [Oscillospiraceae bacterium]|nr:RING finger protein [Oscillospiraceae bacterium]
MTDFTGVKCPVCGVPFQPEDDIVVCPECGAPYHRACYQQEGHCIFEDKHGTAWQFPDERTNPSGDTVRCPKCGHDNTAGALFCEHCGTPLSQQDTGRQNSEQPFNNSPFNNKSSNGQHANGWPYNQAPFAFDPMAGIDPDETIDHVKAGDLCKVVQSNTTYYLPVFMNHEKFRTRRFNFAALILGGGWLLYRKIYALGSIITSAVLALEILNQLLNVQYINPMMLQIMNQLGISSTSSVSTHQLYQIVSAMNSSQMLLFSLVNLCIPLSIFVTHIILGFTANNVYRKHCVKTIQHIQANVSNESEALISYQEKGGINTVLLVMVLICYLIVSNIVNYNSIFLL